MKKLLLLFLLIPILGLSQYSSEEVPIFPGCENRKNKRKCFVKKLQEHIEANFRYPREAVVKKIEGRVYVQFVINTDGKISDIRVRGPHKSLEAEALRIIGKLYNENFTPGKQDGINVRVPFSIPITFRLPKR